MDSLMPTTPLLGQQISFTLPLHNPYVRLGRRAEIENLFIPRGTTCSLCIICAYQEEDKLRVLNPEETTSLHKLIEEEYKESLRFCDSCFKAVIQMIKLSKEIESLQSRLTQSVSCAKAVLKIKRSSSPPSLLPGFCNILCNNNSSFFNQSMCFYRFGTG
jgi:hypothetical protein